MLVAGQRNGYSCVSTNHGSPSSCLAVLRSSGSQWSIDLINRINDSFSCPESRLSRLSRETNGMAASSCTIQRPIDMLAPESRSDPHIFQRESRDLTAAVKTLLCCFATSDKFARRRPNHRNHECQVLEGVVATFAVEYVSKEMLAFKEVPDLLKYQ